MKPPPDKDLGEVYSNIDHVLDASLAVELAKGGGSGRHSAWDFNGTIWFDLDDEQWYEDVWCYQVKVEQFTADTIMGVIQQAIDEYGGR